MAPRLIARSFAFLQPGGERRSPQGIRRPTATWRETPKIARGIRFDLDHCHSSRVKGAVTSTAVGDAGFGADNAGMDGPDASSPGGV